MKLTIGQVDKLKKHPKKDENISICVFDEIKKVITTHGEEISMATLFEVIQNHDIAWCREQSLHGGSKEKEIRKHILSSLKYMMTYYKEFSYLDLFHNGKKIVKKYDVIFAPNAINKILQGYNTYAIGIIKFIDGSKSKRLYSLYAQVYVTDTNRFIEDNEFNKGG